MGKGCATGGQPGWSASAEGRRARRARHRHRLVRAICLVVAARVAVAGLAARSYWLVGVSLIALAAGWWDRADPDPGRWARGADGEIATAEVLARLPRRFIVLHDRRQPGRDGNIDHLVVGPSGVWVVDSKARRARLRVKRGQVWAGDHVIDTMPVAWQAAVVGEALNEPVTALVAVHGEGLRRRGKKVGGVRVVPARRLRRQLRRGRRRLPRPDVAALAALAERVFPSNDAVRRGSSGA